MTISLGVLKNAEPALRKLLNADLPITTAFALSKLVKAVEGELTTHEERRQALVRKHGEADAEGNFTVAPEAYEAFFADIGELNAIEVELLFAPVPVAKLDGVKLSPVDLSLLSEFVTE